MKKIATMLKSSKIILRDGKYKDVNSVYSGLPDGDKEYVTPGRRTYGDFPRTLAGRTVAYDSGMPVGFADIVGVFDSALHVNTAVSPSHRGKGLSSAMVQDALRKVVSQIHENRGKSPSGLDIKRIYWVLDKNNTASARAAEKAGFKKKYRLAFRRHKNVAYQLSLDDAYKKFT
jgi:RimJ/RimL family protein N-acetyltransferase